MEFTKYQHVERLGNLNVSGIENGTCHVFPKIDGTNASIWREDNQFCAGSRNRKLEVDKDNAGFYNAVLNESQFDGIKELLNCKPSYIIYGEWLVPHSLKTYRDDCWRKFYLFDIYDTQTEKYISYDIYSKLCDSFKINYIPCLQIIKNGNEESFYKCLEKNNYLIQDGLGFGEGIVIKNYDYENKFGRITWAKIVTSEFKEKHIKEMGPNLYEVKDTETEIVESFCTKALIEKTYAKILNEEEGWNSKLIPRLLNSVYYNLINEDIWEILKKLKQPIINFKRLNGLVIMKIKETLPELF